MRRFNWLWPTVTNEDEAKSAAKQAAGTALFVTVCTGGIAILALATGRSYVGIDGFGLVDATLFGIVAWRLFRYSFPWAIFGFVLFLFEIYSMLRDHVGHFGVVTIIIVLGFAAGVRGTFFLRHQKKRLLAESAIVQQVDNSPIEPT